MIIKKLFLITGLLCPCFFSLANETRQRTVIITDAPPASMTGYYNYYKSTHNDYNEFLELEVIPVKDVPVKLQYNELREKIVNGEAKWVFDVKEVCIIRLPWLRQSIYIRSGDSLNIDLVNGAPVVTGRGAAAFQVQYLMAEHENNSTLKPERPYVVIDSLEVFLAWAKYVDEQLNFSTRLLKQYQDKIDPLLYNAILNGYIRIMEYQRIEAFICLWSHEITDKYGKRNLSVRDLKNIADSQLNKPSGAWLRSQDAGFAANGASYFYAYAQVQVWKEQNFNFSGDGFHSQAQRLARYLEEVKKLYKGETLKKVLQYMISEKMVEDIGYRHPLSRQTLSYYYSVKGLPEDDEWMKAYEKTAGMKYDFSNDGEEGDSSDSVPVDFMLNDPKGGRIGLRRFRNKLVVLYMWKPDCNECRHIEPYLSKVKDAFRGDSTVVFVNLGTGADRNGWINYVNTHKDVLKGINLHLDDSEESRRVIEDLSVSSYPELIVLGERGGVARRHADTLMRNGEGELVSWLRKKRAQFNDGPYVFYRDGKPVTTYIREDKAVVARDSAAQSVTVTTDLYPQAFNVLLKSTLATEPVLYSQPEKLLVLSDIEGNFDAMRKLLQANKVIDKNYNWTFGKGHLVCTGDFFDRGWQVTEVLWLIYSLEDKAKRAGGYVHFILGNHEIMNLYGKTKYVVPKYLHSARLINTEYINLYGTNTELGRWLRTKNVIEKIGDGLYMHGGFSKMGNSLDLSLEQINNKVRPYYGIADVVKNNPQDAALQTLYSSSNGPFWYRGYYFDKNQEGIVDSTLQKFDVRHIMTGHTIMADTVNVWYSGKVINTDVHHAEGKSEALLIEGDRFYRVNDTGEKKLLFTDDRKNRHK